MVLLRISYWRIGPVTENNRLPCCCALRALHARLGATHRRNGEAPTFWSTSILRDSCSPFFGPRQAATKAEEGSSPEEIDRMEREMENLSKEFRQVENTHGHNVLNLVTSVAYLRKLLAIPSSTMVGAPAQGG